MTRRRQTSRSHGLRRRTAGTGGRTTAAVTVGPLQLLRLLAAVLSVAFFCCFSLFVVVPGASATRISWQAAHDPTDSSNAADSATDAKTAPRSQRYWDEHGVVRPDYAKTDDELRAERRRAPTGEEDTSSLRPWTVALAIGLVGGMMAGLWTLHVVRTSNAGTGKLGEGERLGGGGTTDERARLARLAKFESTPAKTD